MKTRGTIIFILFVVVVVAVVGISQFLRSQPPLEVTVAVNPIALDWAQELATAFNATEPVVNGSRRVQVRVTPVDDLQVWGADGGSWNLTDHPDGWIPGTSASLDYANAVRLPFTEIQPSLAHTLLAWGGFTDAVEDITANGEPLDWTSIQAYMENERLSLALPHPGRSLAGLAVAIAGAGDYHDSTTLAGQQVTDPGFRAWLVEMLGHVPNFNTLGALPAETLAARGQSAGAVALLPESQWLTNLRGQLVNSSNPVTLSYPEYNIDFDFPLAVWDDTAATDDADAGNKRAALEAFGNFASGAAQQLTAANYGLRPPTVLLEAGSAGLFDAGVPYGTAIEAPAMPYVEPPSRTDLLALIGAINQAVR